MYHTPAFRAYIDNEMIYFGKSNNVSNIIAFCEDMWVFLKHDSVYMDVPSWDTMYQTGKKDDETIPIMICTHTEDKNGTLIWEGDILATSNSDPKYAIWSKEEYEYAIVKFNVITGTLFEGIKSGTPWNFMDQASIYSLQHLEVIGNIYENSELLEITNV